MTYKIIITFILALCLSNLFTKVVVEDIYDSELEVFKKNQASRDSIMIRDSIAICKLQIERDSLSFLHYKMNYKLDSTITIIKSQLKVIVTNKDIINALKWIRDTHGIEDPTIE